MNRTGMPWPDFEGWMKPKLRFFLNKFLQCLLLNHGEWIQMTEKGVVPLSSLILKSYRWCLENTCAFFSLDTSAKNFNRHYIRTLVPWDDIRDAVWWTAADPEFVWHADQLPKIACAWSLKHWLHDRFLKFLAICPYQVIPALFMHLTFIGNPTFTGNPAFSFNLHDFTDHNEKTNLTWLKPHYGCAPLLQLIRKNLICLSA